MRICSKLASDPRPRRPWPGCLASRLDIITHLAARQESGSSCCAQALSLKKRRFSGASMTGRVPHGKAGGRARSAQAPRHKSEQGSAAAPPAASSRNRAITTSTEKRRSQLGLGRRGCLCGRTASVLVGCQCPARPAGAAALGGDGQGACVGCSGFGSVSVAQ